MYFSAYFSKEKTKERKREIKIKKEKENGRKQEETRKGCFLRNLSVTNAMTQVARGAGMRKPEEVDREEMENEES